MNRQERLEFRMELAELIGDVCEETSSHGGRFVEGHRGLINELRVAAHAVAQTERDKIFKLMTAGEGT